MNKLTQLALIEAMMNGGSAPFTNRLIRHSYGTSKSYKNKNSNIEYYTDEKGNIRRRRK